eukprot:751382-Hanusia_phi.AAC.4
MASASYTVHSPDSDSRAQLVRRGLCPPFGSVLSSCPSSQHRVARSCSSYATTRLRWKSSAAFLLHFGPATPWDVCFFLSLPESFAAVHQA